MSLNDLRTLLGNSVRFTIDVNDRGPCDVGARWACGCAAHGNSFNACTTRRALSTARARE